LADKHLRTFRAIYASPVRANITWKDVVALLKHPGATLDESAEGSRVHAELNGAESVLHRPHPQKEIKQYVVRDLREFLGTAGVDLEAES